MQPSLQTTQRSLATMPVASPKMQKARPWPFLVASQGRAEGEMMDNARRVIGRTRELWAMGAKVSGGAHQVG